MDQLIKKFPLQIKEALELGELANISPHHFPIHKIILCGMGGSAVGGQYAADLIIDECTCPFIIQRSYQLPAFVDKHCLVILSSYSGNTEEVLTCAHKASTTGAKIVCLASGGKLLEMAISNNWDKIVLPDNWSSPRACIGYSFVGQLYILHKLGLISKAVIDNIRIGADLLLFEQEDIIVKAESLAQAIFQKIPIVYTTDRSEAVAMRWIQQFNENAKMLGWYQLIPEMNHNELVGWHRRRDDVAVIFLRLKDDLKRNQSRIELTKQIVHQYASCVIEVYAKGQSLSEKMMYLTHVGDWVSWFLATLNQVNATSIQNIDFVKSELDKSVI